MHIISIYIISILTLWGFTPRGFLILYIHYTCFNSLKQNEHSINNIAIASMCYPFFSLKTKIKYETCKNSIEHNIKLSDNIHTQAIEHVQTNKTNKDNIIWKH